MAADMLPWTIGVHGTIFTISLVGLYRYSDRTGMYSKAVGDMDSLLARMRSHVVAAFENGLQDVFLRSEGEPKTVSIDGYTERSTNPLGSDEFRQALNKIVEGDVDILVDYWKTYRASKTWGVWARILSWSVLILAIWEVICVAGFGLGPKLFDFTIPDPLLRWSFGPTIFLVILFFVCQVGMLNQHDVIQNSKSKYHEI